MAEYQIMKIISKNILRKTRAKKLWNFSGVLEEEEEEEDAKREEAFFL